MRLGESEVQIILGAGLDQFEARRSNSAFDKVRTRSYVSDGRSANLVCYICRSIIWRHVVTVHLLLRP